MGQFLPSDPGNISATAGDAPKYGVVNLAKFNLIRMILTKNLRYSCLKSCRLYRFAGMPPMKAESHFESEYSIYLISIQHIG